MKRIVRFDCEDREFVHKQQNQFLYTRVLLGMTERRLNKSLICIYEYWCWWGNEGYGGISNVNLHDHPIWCLFRALLDLMQAGEPCADALHLLNC